MQLIKGNRVATLHPRSYVIHCGVPGCPHVVTESSESRAVEEIEKHARYNHSPSWPLSRPVDMWLVNGGGAA